MAEEIIDIRLFLRGAREAEAQLLGTARAADKLGAAGRRAGAEGATGLARFAKHADSIHRVGRTMTHAFTMPLLGAAAAGVKFSVDFDKNMTMIQTQTNTSASDVKKLRSQVLDLAGTVPYGPNALAKGLYHLKSVGLPASQAMGALKIAAEGATMGGADLEQTTTALASAWRSGIKGAGGFKHTMAVLNATVGAGNMHMQDMVEALGTGVLPAAKIAGLSLQDVGTALATLTDEGWQGSSAMAQFSTALHFLYNPTTKAATAMQTMGLAPDQLAKDLRKPNGLITALTDLHTHLEHGTGAGAKWKKVMTPTGAQFKPANRSAVAQEQLLGQILPGGRGRVMAVLLNQLAVMDKKHRQIFGATQKFDQGRAAAMGTDAAKLGMAWGKTEKALIKLGDALRPAVIPIITGLATGLGALVTVFGDLPTPLKVATISLLGLLAVGGPMLIFTASVLKAIKDLKEMKTALGELKLVQAITGPTGLGKLKAGAALPFKRFKSWFVKTSAVAGAEAGATEATAHAGGSGLGSLISKARNPFRRFKRWLIGSSAVAGAEAGAAEGGAMAAGMSSAGMLSKFRGVGLLLGKVLGGVMIASILARLARVENADPLLFLHPPAAGDPRPGHGDIQPTHGAVSWLQKHHVGSIPAGVSPEQWARRHGWRGRRHGGQVSAGVPYLVGEAGVPEIFTPETTGRVDPLKPSRSTQPLTFQNSRAEAGQGDMVAYVVLDGKKVARAVFKHEEDAKARQ